MGIELFEYRNSRQGLLYSTHYTDFLKRKTATSYPNITILLLHSPASFSDSHIPSYYCQQETQVFRCLPKEVVNGPRAMDNPL
jgi:hypothetical protein